ncbi:energy transducer TonB [Steroidobacter flavus]|uniref:Energy transducer TonB n=1 Tax=Steroidobacter flavus TaxID=1842136 RepID=A0ABV8T1Q3_9GAMM
MRNLQHWPSHALGLTASVLLHSALFLSVSLGSVAAPKRAPDESGAGATAIVSSTGSFMTLVIVHTPGPTDASMAMDVASRGSAIANPVIQIVSPDPTPSFEMPEFASLDESGEASVTAGDPVRQSMLFGRYTGQINGRIQRVWRKPRSAIDESSAAAFQCQARITQNQDGSVTEIELMQCNGSAEWQLSLVRAIQQASPLPAPPDPSVFTSELMLAFEAKAYAPGDRDDEYEPEPRPTRTGVAYLPPALSPPDQTE